MINSYLTKTELQQKQEVFPSKCLAFFFFDTWNSKSFLSLSLQDKNIHTSVIVNTELFHVCPVKLKEGSDSVEFLFTPLVFTHTRSLAHLLTHTLGLAYFDIWDLGWGWRTWESGGNAVDFQWIGALGDITETGGWVRINMTPLNTTWEQQH